MTQWAPLHVHCWHLHTTTPILRWSQQRLIWSECGPQTKIRWKHQNSHSIWAWVVLLGCCGSDRRGCRRKNVVALRQKEQNQLLEKHTATLLGASNNIVLPGHCNSKGGEILWKLVADGEKVVAPKLRTGNYELSRQSSCTNRWYSSKCVHPHRHTTLDKLPQCLTGSKWGQSLFARPLRFEPAGLLHQKSLLLSAITDVSCSANCCNRT